MNNIPIFLSPNMSRYMLSVALAFLFLFSEIAETCMCSANSSMQFPCIPREREALVKFKSSFPNPSNRLSSWKGNNCCQWEGIACNNNVTSHVVKLDLMNLELEAPNVDESLLELEYLSYLDLSGNDFQGSPIPIFIGSMQRLTHLSLSEASFSGRIPSSLGNLTNLSYLDLSWNAYYYLNSIDINWIPKLGSLEHLDLTGVYLGGVHNLFQVLNTLSSLLRIYLGVCGLVNLTCPLVNVTNNKNAPHQLLDLSWNHLTSSGLDTAFKNMTTSLLVHLDLRRNNLDSVPSWLSSCKKLKFLDLSTNDLHGPISNTFRNMTSIESLYLSSNHLTTVPCLFGEFKKLVHLDLSYNDLAHIECSLSSILTNLCYLRSLYFSDNKLQKEHIGDSELSGCVTFDLEVLDLSQSEFGGRLPTYLGQLENLEYLDLGSNFFFGPIPSFLGKLVKLEELDLYGNMFDGHLPNQIGQLFNLTHLDVSSNKLSGFIPHSFVQLVNLQWLDLSNNNLFGTIPKNIGKLVNMEYIDLSNNILNGTIPNDFDKLKNLNYIDLSSNKLDGIITVGKEWSSTMPQLWFLNLSCNHIRGSLPRNTGNIMPNLETLLLRSNQINGSIPNSFCQTKVTYLDIAKNKLSGEIPNCWRDTLICQEIDLSFNKLSGVFPSSFGNLSSLLFLHLNNNNLQGQLPVSMNGLKNLLICDVSENQFSGTMPSWTSNTSFPLQVLKLRHNKLSGCIPSQLCQLASLKILDLSLNNLEGSIPWCISNLKGMFLGSSFEEANGSFQPTFLTLNTKSANIPTSVIDCPPRTAYLDCLPRDKLDLVGIVSMSNKL